LTALWLRGLAATGILYAIGVVIYFCATDGGIIKTERVEQQAAAMGGQLHERAATQGAL
jgi:hypothetical protein